MTRQVLSIAAAPGWAARYVDENGEKVVTLLAWALVQEGLTQSLVGYVRSRQRSPTRWLLSSPDEVDGFGGWWPAHFVHALQTRPSGERTLAQPSVLRPKPCAQAM